MATIFCFSSTGNSLYAAKKIAEAISADVVSMTKPAAVCGDDVVGFVFPAYFWGLPKIVERFILSIDITNKDAYIFTVVTYGGTISGITGIVKNLLKKKGLELSYGANLKSVENYIPGYVVNDSEELHKSADENLAVISIEIAERRRNRPESVTPLNKLIQAAFPGKRGDCDQFFIISEKCNGCGVCQGVCPASNITIENGKPNFKHDCEHCMACIHACPSNAMEWKQSTAGKQRYRNPHIGLQELQSFSGVQ